ncbi:bestrophin family protein [Adhaeribacter aquaticus]|uniref:bestrophin family protein n=1 Tax=Adhaeribacter aquaticus TaxID=299567 RepID=UPI0003FC6F10|nr:bestrophin family ion channel [Adhaeribacter aquaticus]
MLVRRNITWNMILHYTWKSMLYYILLAIAVYLLHDFYKVLKLHIPFTAITALSTALAIFLGFKTSNAYERWWEARQIWGALVNYSRAWTRQVITMIIPANNEEASIVKAHQSRMVYRHIAFVHGLRVFLRKKHVYNDRGKEEISEEPNEYSDANAFISADEYEAFIHKQNPPNFLLEQQGKDLQLAFNQGWLSDFRFVKLEETLVEFNNIQGRSERIKNTPFLRQYSFFSRVFVFIHASLLPFVFVEDLSWASIPVSVIISFVFLCLDLIGERSEDPFENRLEDVPLTALSLTIETNVKEQWGDTNFPAKKDAPDGIVL